MVNAKTKGMMMTKNEINILNQELCVLLSLDFDATRHGLEISSLILKCVLKDDAEEMTPYKSKVIEEIQLQWRFLKFLHNDIEQIAAKLNMNKIVPAVPILIINNDLWKIEKSGASEALYEINDKISNFQSQMQNCIFKLQELCG